MFVWSRSTGARAIVLDTSWRFAIPLGINNRGQIVGQGEMLDGKTHGFVLSPDQSGSVTTIPIQP